MSTANTISDPSPAPPPRSLWGYIGGLAPVILVWVLLVAWLAGLVYASGQWAERADEAAIREWLDETRVFRKTLPELVREFAALRQADPTGTVHDEAVRLKRDEIREHMRGLAEPTRAYLNQLPTFPVVYRIEVELLPSNSGPLLTDVVAWDSPLPRPRQQNQSRVRVLEFHPLSDNASVAIRCEYQLHAFNKLQRQADERQRASLVAWAVLVAATVLAGLFVYRFLRRERVREQQQLAAQADAEHRQRELLEIRLRQKEAEQAAEELDRKLLEHRLEAAAHQQRADEAEKVALGMKSELYASIGIMAGSYAHNIKNLLVRPNDLLARCIEVNGLSGEQTGMLEEVRSTLGTVTDRLQQILRTVRRDPNKAEMTQVDIGRLVRDTASTWVDMGRDKWKLRVTADAPTDPLTVRGDLSHLQQAVENLVFNARDATFEMRNHLREEARRVPAEDALARRQRLLDAVAWKGEVELIARAEGNTILLEVRDNGIGMTEDVRQNCHRTHFTTKRDNALYEGYSAGMGLGLSFVAVVLEHHGASLEIESQPRKGSVFRIRFLSGVTDHPEADKSSETLEGSRQSTGG